MRFEGEAEIQHKRRLPEVENTCLEWRAVRRGHPLLSEGGGQC